MFQNVIVGEMPAGRLAQFQMSAGVGQGPKQVADVKTVDLNETFQNSVKIVVVKQEQDQKYYYFGSRLVSWVQVVQKVGH